MSEARSPSASRSIVPISRRIGMRMSRLESTIRPPSMTVSTTTATIAPVRASAAASSLAAPALSARSRVRSSRSADARLQPGVDRRARAQHLQRLAGQVAARADAQRIPQFHVGVEIVGQGVERRLLRRIGDEFAVFGLQLVHPPLQLHDVHLQHVGLLRALLEHLVGLGDAQLVEHQAHLRRQAERRDHLLGQAAEMGRHDRYLVDGKSTEAGEHHEDDGDAELDFPPDRHAGPSPIRFMSVR